MVLINTLSLVLALCALLYELLIARTVSLWAYNNVVWYALAVGVFIGGMGLGAWWSVRKPHQDLVWRRLFNVECWVALAGGCSVLLIHLAALLALLLGQTGHETIAKLVFFGTAFIASLAVGFGAGMELPLLMAMSDGVSNRPKTERTAQILFMDYAGALVAGLVFPFIIIPFVDVLAATFLIALLNGLAGLVLLWHYKAAAGRKRAWALVLLFASLFHFAPRLEQYFVTKYYFSFQDELSLQDFFQPRHYPGSVERIRSQYQIIDLVNTDDMGPEARGLSAAFIKGSPQDNKSLEGMVLFLNHDFQFAASFERIYHEAFVHIPRSVLRVPLRRVLILGAGDGLLLREVLKYPEVRDVVLVEIDPKVVDIFKHYRSLAGLNDGAFYDPRVHVITGDAYQYVRQEKETFDMIFCDFPNPDDYDLAKLYSREFYAFAKSRLSPEGLLVIDAPGVEEGALDKKGSYATWQILSNTLFAAGFSTIKPFFSRLEDDNAAALSVLGGDPETLRGLTESLSAGFIIASSEVQDLIPGPLDVPGLRVMNAARVAMGLADRANLVFVPDARAVNSILRPVLPLRSDWSKIKIGY